MSVSGSVTVSSSSEHARQIVWQSSLCEASVGSAAGSLVIRMAPVCGSVSQTQAGMVASPALLDGLTVWHAAFF